MISRNHVRPYGGPLPGNGLYECQENGPHDRLRVLFLGEGMFRKKVQLVTREDAARMACRMGPKPSSDPPSQLGVANEFGLTRLGGPKRPFPDAARHVEVPWEGVAAAARLARSGPGAGASSGLLRVTRSRQSVQIRASNLSLLSSPGDKRKGHGMSRSRNATKLAKSIVRRTSLKQSTASRLAKQAHMHLGSPVADSPDPLQRRLEAYVAHVLADGLRDHQLNGALLGVRRAELRDQNLKLQLEPDMANEVLRILLPRFDHSYGGVRGVAGLRVRGNERCLDLYDATTAAQVTVARSDGGPIRLPSARDNEVLLWKRVPGGSSRDEQQEAEDWTASRGIEDLRVRDLLFSRLLRCPELVNGTAAPHGFANCYTHHPGDLVIEWCCGESVEALCAHLLAHGFADDVPRADAIRLFSQHSAQFGRATVILNRHASCLYGRHAQEITRSIREGYAS
ncbi:hypothetical protein ACFYM2_26945 [Streptomyces sp. NPDC006711]|uniref:hypothetical protein n=2 Tax=unclassified Streptomyces TaxID=2593676 RepID=UPI0036B87416